MRELAYRVLTQIEEQGCFSNLALKDALAASGLSGRDRALTTALVYGVLRERLFLDSQIERFCDRSKTPEKVMRLLRLGAVQILCMDKIPPSAAVNETVRLAHRIAPHAAGCCNGVLRKIAASGAVLPEEGTDLYFSVRYSVPMWLVKKWKKQFSEEPFEAFLSAITAPQPTVIRFDPNKIGADELNAQIGGLEPTVFEDAFVMTDGTPPNEPPAWQRGAITAMQLASMAACRALAPKSGDAVCDLCAAPGGKTAYLSQLMGGGGRIDAWELHPHRAELLKAHLARMGCANVTVTCKDSSVAEGSEQYDKILLDAPCSGLGVIGRKPELKWQDPDRIAELLPVQSRLLRTAARLLKTGGVMVYCTCTLNRAENETAVSALLAEMPQMRTDPTFADGIGMKNLLPHRDGMGGFFIARLIKGKEA